MLSRLCLLPLLVVYGVFYLLVEQPGIRFSKWIRHLETTENNEEPFIFSKNSR